MLEVTLRSAGAGSIDRLDLDVANRSDRPLQLLYWGTMFDPLCRDFLDVMLPDGYCAPDVGPRAKYAFDPDHSLEELGAGEVRTMSVDLHGLYDLPLSGQYEVSLKPRDWQGADVGRSARPAVIDALEAVEVRASGSVHVVLTAPADPGRPPRPKLAPAELAAIPDEPACPPLAFCVPPAYKDQGGECRGLQYISYPRLNQFSSAREKLVRTLSTELYARLYRYRVGNSAAFVRWFGPWSEASRATVQAVINGIQGQGLCKNHTIWSISYPPKPDMIAAFHRHDDSSAEPWDGMGLYPLYWKEPDHGVDSKIGTLAHELSHGYGDTEDHAYGQAKCLALARRDPGKAMANADSYQYFLEELILRKP
jgi:peptidyl-Lys metalloendopeptidase